MHRINLRLNVIDPGLEWIGIELEDNRSLFVQSGSMQAILQGGDPSTPVTWTQISGVAVTVTSGVNDQLLTFTTSELGKKRFKVCVNVGSAFEECAEADFYHFPIEYLYPSNRFLNSNMVQNWMPTSALMSLRGYASIGALTNFNVNVPHIVKNITQIKPGQYDRWTDFTVTGLGSINLNAIKKTRIEIYNIATSMWVLWKEYSKAVTQFSGVDGLTGKSIRVVYSIAYYGIFTEIIVGDDTAIQDMAETSGGREVSTITNKILSSKINDYQYQLGKHTTKPFSDTLEHNNLILNSNISGYDAVLSTAGSISLTETIVQPTLILNSNTAEYLAVLHTSTGVI